MEQKGKNGHGDIDKTIVTPDPLEWPYSVVERKQPMQSLIREGWKVMTGSRSRRASDEDEVAPRSPSQVSMALFKLFGTIGVLQIGALIWLLATLSNQVSNHDKVLSSSGFTNLLVEHATLKNQNAALQRQIDKQEDFIQSILFYCAAVQRTIIEKTRLNSSDLPEIPVRHKGDAPPRRANQNQEEN